MWFAILGNARAMVRVATQIIALFVVCTVATRAMGANPVGYSVTDLGVLSGPGSYPQAMNSFDQVVG